MPCSAKLPIIALISGRSFRQFMGRTFCVFHWDGGHYFIRYRIEKTALFAGDPAPFIMELPAYHLPQLGTVLKSAIDRAVAFIKKPERSSSLHVSLSGLLLATTLPLIEWGRRKHLSLFGRLLAPIFAPLGWGTWRGAVATITGLVAKENVIGTFGFCTAKVGFLKPVQRSGKCCEAITPQ